MKALVTGGGGFLGSAIVRKLVLRNDSVRSFSRNTYQTLTDLKVEHAPGDLADLDAVTRAAEGCDIVFHVGAKAGFWGSYEDYHAANVTGTENVVSACLKLGINRLVYTSSPSVVFNGKDMEGVDESAPYSTHFNSFYPQTKAKAEKIVLAANNKQLATVSLRPHMIFGPGDNHLIPRVLSKARAGRLLIVGDGKNKIDTVYVDNAATAHLLAADKLFPESSISGKAYFISNGDPRTIKTLLDFIMDTHGLPRIKRRVPKALAYFGGWVFENIYQALGIKQEPLVTRFIAEEFSSSHWFDISAARKELGYDPEISIEEGFERIKSHLKAQQGR